MIKTSQFPGRIKLLIMLILLVLGCVLISLALIIGIDDNLPGILLCYSGIASVVYAFVHHWRKIKGFVILMVVSLAGFIVFAVLHNVLEGLGFEVVGTGCFLIAIFICPVTLLIGLAGSIVIGIRQ